MVRSQPLPFFESARSPKLGIRAGAVSVVDLDQNSSDVGRPGLFIDAESKGALPDEAPTSWMISLRRCQDRKGISAFR